MNLPEPNLGLDGYYCLACNKFLPAVDGVIVHDNVPHPPELNFNELENPQ